MTGGALLGRLEPRFIALDTHLRRRPRPERGTADPTSADVSVVVQGPIAGRPDDPPDARITQQTLRSVRTVLPAAELILSTWRGSDLTGLDADRVVLSEDPGPDRSRDLTTPILNNVNRQVVVTRAGLEHATRRLAMKLRTDMLLVHDGVLTLHGGWPARADELRILEERVLAPTHFSFNPRRVYDNGRFLYTVSDWSHFGLREDLLDLWSVPHWDVSFEWLLGRRIVAVEQWLWMSLLNRHDAGASFDRPDALRHSELSVANNTVLVEPEDMGVRFGKFELSARHRTALYTHGEWQRLYTRHCLRSPVAVHDAQGLLRTAADQLWLRRLSPRLIGELPFDARPVSAPVVPPATPNRPEVVGSEQA